MNIKVSIPVTLGGYTGQRDQWEEGLNDYAVTFDPYTKMVALKAEGSVQRKIVFSFDDLKKAVEFVTTHRDDIEPTKPEDCEHKNVSRKERGFSDDSYDQWNEMVNVCDDCGEWWR